VDVRLVLLIKKKKIPWRAQRANEFFPFKKQSSPKSGEERLNEYHEASLARDLGRKVWIIDDMPFVL